MVFRKKDPIEAYDNQIRGIEVQEVELSEKLARLGMQKINLLNDRKDAGIKKYLDADKRKKILEEARSLGFSAEIIERLMAYSDNWDQDCVTNAIIDEFESVVLYVKKQMPHRNNLLYRLGDIGFKDKVEEGNSNDA